MKNRLITIFIFIFFVTVRGIYAQGKLSLEALIGLAVKQDFTVQLIEQELNKVNVESKITKAGILPTVSLNSWNGYFDGRYYDPLKNQYFYSPTMIGNVGLSSSWGIYNGGYRNIKMNIDQIAIGIQALNMENKRREVSREVINLYSSIIQTNKLIEVYQKKIDLYQAETIRLKELFALGKVTSVDTSVVALTRIDAEDKQLQLKYKLELDIHQLELITNESLTIGDLETNPQFELQSVNLNDEAFNVYNDSIALRNSSISYRIKELEIEKAKLSTSLQKAQYKPSVKFEAGIHSGYSSNLRNEQANRNAEGKYVFLKQFESNRFSSTSLNIYVPIYDRKNKLLQRQNRIGENMAEIEKVQMGKKVYAKYSMAKKELSVKYKKLQVAQVQVSEINKLLTNYKERFALGRLRITDLLIANERLIDSEMNHCNNYFDFFITLKVFELDYKGNLTY